MRTAVIAVIVPFLGQAAMADCPTVADMERGVVLGFADGSSSHLRRETGSVMVRTNWTPLGGGPGSISVDAHGLFPVGGGSADLSEMDSGFSFTYDVPAENLPGPGPSLRITLDRIFGGMPPHHEGRSVYVTGPERAMTLAGCTFSGFDVVATDRSRVAAWSDQPPGAYKESKFASIYLSDLGIRIGLWQEDENGVRRVLPEVVSIAALP